MHPTEAQVVEFIKAHPGCKSKVVAAHFNVAAHVINKARDTDDYRGVYNMPEFIVSKAYCHYPVQVQTVASDDEQSCLDDTNEDLSSQIEQFTAIDQNIEAQGQELQVLKQALEAQATAHAQVIEDMQEQMDNMAAQIEALISVTQKPKPKLKMKPKPLPEPLPLPESEPED